MSDQFEKGIQYEIYVGLKDKDSYQEILTEDDFKDILTEICMEKEVAFSLLTQFGGYSHQKGYTTETSFRIILLGLDEEEITLMSQKLKEKINTDTVLITKTDVDYMFV